MRLDFRARLLASSLLLGIAGPAWAQTADTTPAEPAAPASAVAPDAAGQAEPADGDTIVVTGSRLGGESLRQASPISVVSAKEIALSGQINVESVLKDLPQLIPSTTAASNNPGGGVATADLRGLGSTRTLVLVNNRRYVAYDSNQVVDLNTIPAALIERVDIVTGGRSAVYGSDAISGVVNFVMKKDFSGVAAGANYRINEAGDGGTFNGNLLIGGNFEDGRGNATIYFDYTKRNGILQSARDYSRQALVDDGAGGLIAGGSGSIEGTRFALGGVNRKFETDGSYTPYNASTDAYNYAPSNYLQVPQQRFLMSAQTHYEVSPALNVYAEGQLINNRVKNQLAPTPFTGSVALDVDSSFLSPSSQALLRSRDTDGDGYVTSTIYRRLTEVGARVSSLDNTAYRAVLGANGDIGGGWNYDAYYSYARTRSTETQSGNVSRSRVLQALRTTYDASGNLVCSDTSNGCVPLNIFGAGNISAAAADFITIPAQNTSTISEQVASASISNRNLFDLGAGPVGIVFGTEYRREHGSYNPDFALSSGDVVGFNAGEGLSGGYDVKEAYTELAVPLLANIPLIKKLEVNGAYRYSYYSTAAKSVNTYSGGVVWSLIDDLSLRGQYSRAVRAPTVSDLYSGSSQDFPAATDPCTTAVAVTNTNLNASCVSTGVPASLIGTAYDGGSTQIQTVNGGNPALREETSDTYTGGIVLQPRFLPRFSLTVDYYKIKIANYISTVGTTNLIRACYGDADNGYTPYNASYCSSLPRDSNSYAITDAVNTLANTGGVTTRGVDFEARYGLPLGFGAFGAESSKLDFRVSGTRLIAFNYNPLAAISDLTINCAGKFGQTCGNPYAKWRLSSRTTYSTGPVTVSVLYRYLSPVKDDDSGTVYAVERIKAYHYFDLTAAFDIKPGFTWSVGVNNIFDKQPPIMGDNQQQANTYPSTYDPYGRAFFVSTNVKF
ncbi:TonB-dependent receptor-like protein [Sphingomonas aurantiaca]|uniref:TonB-dependent receptor-like protein n=1 Tax=Sphingomonas aurantiaca TaxID=185949 RepID=A0A2T5GLM2_9SPHN|nr:TonB-dependent receptor [Sphingomonas aurantiaca]PTQ60226.1 TonB-dependent receptor-like protein [Sphingomonas aurantiaca]